MSEAGWTRQGPTVKGFYWYRPVHYKAEPRVLEIGSGMTLPLIVLNTDRFYVSQWDGEWLGPITPDSYAAGRVAGLQEATKAMCMYCNDPEWQERDEEDNHSSPHTRSMYPCIAWKIQERIRQIEQQAHQGTEGGT